MGSRDFAESPPGTPAPPAQPSPTRWLVPYSPETTMASRHATRVLLSELRCSRLLGQGQSDDAYNVIRGPVRRSTKAQGPALSLRSLGWRPTFHQRRHADLIKEIRRRARPVRHRLLHKGPSSKPSRQRPLDRGTGYEGGWLDPQRSPTVRPTSRGGYTRQPPTARTSNYTPKNWIPLRGPGAAGGLGSWFCKGLQQKPLADLRQPARTGCTFFLQGNVTRASLGALRHLTEEEPPASSAA